MNAHNQRIVQAERLTRLQHVDVARGICILLVALGHNTVLVLPESAFGQVLATFRMPLLFFIAGTLFKPGQSLPELAWHKADALIKPFLVMALLHAPLRIAFWHADPLAYGLGVLSGSGNYLPWLYALWFLPHLWLLFVAAWALLRVFDHFSLAPAARLATITGLLMLSNVLMSMFWMKPLPFGGDTWLMKGLPFSADILPVSGFFFMLGHVLRQHTLRLEFRWGTVMLSVAIMCCVMLNSRPVVSLLDRHYADLFACTVAALSGIAFVLYLSKLLTQFHAPARILAFCGANSLFILIFHSPIQNNVLTQLLKLWPNQSLWTGVVAWLICIGSSLVLARMIRQHHWLRMLFLPIRKGAPRLQPTRPATASVVTLPIDVQDTPTSVQGMR